MHTLWTEALTALRLLARIVPGVVLGCGLTACGDPEIVVPDVLETLVLPSHGSTQIATELELQVYFTHPVPDAVVDQVDFVCLGAPPCDSATSASCTTANPDVTTTYQPDNQVVLMVPTASLQNNTCYQIRIAEGVAPLNGRISPLPFEVRSTFQTR